MAPIKDNADQAAGSDGENADESQNLWASILGEVQSSSSSKLPSCKSVLLLGDNESGKTTLVAKLQGNEDPRKGSGLEYHYIDVRDEYRDDQTKLGVWILDGDPHHNGLLKFSLSASNFSNTLVMIVVSMTTPWAIMESLRKWSKILSEHIDRLRISPEQMKDFEQNIVRQFQEYVEPEEGQNVVQSPPRRVGPHSAHPHTEEEVLLPLSESTLCNNLGIPILVVVTKTDAISTLEKDHDYREEHFDFIQQHIRKFCLNYGAPLFYVSVKEEKNVDLLYKYLLHRIYGFPFTIPAYVVERDSVFIPSGWDNEKKISILYENMNSMRPEDAFEDVITKPVLRKTIQRDAEVMAEDEQVFLMKQQTQLSKAPAAAGTGKESPIRPAGTQRPGATPRTSASPGTGSAMAAASPKKLDVKTAVKATFPSLTAKLDAKGAGTSEGVLANFFNSLLSKKTGAPTTGAPPPTARPVDKNAVSRDAAAELDRLTRTKKPLSSGQSTDNQA